MPGSLPNTVIAIYMSSIVEKKRCAPRVVRWILPFFLLAAASVILPKAKAQVPLNDFFTNAQPISGLFGQFIGNSTGATRETNEPIHYAGSPLSARSVWF